MINLVKLATVFAVAAVLLTPAIFLPEKNAEASTDSIIRRANMAFVITEGSVTTSVEVAAVQKTASGESAVRLSIKHCFGEGGEGRCIQRLFLGPLQVKFSAGLGHASLKVVDGDDSIIVDLDWQRNGDRQEQEIPTDTGSIIITTRPAIVTGTVARISVPNGTDGSIVREKHSNH